mmetsp:Transcript_9429/g.30776  ORF Transcript_9429/g.30776 Transcript_9429/m.30776 type:complete len:186 (-) Transcript_9429:454-1011(-)
MASFVLFPLFRDEATRLECPLALREVDAGYELRVDLGQPHLSKGQLKIDALAKRRQLQVTIEGRISRVARIRLPDDARLESAKATFQHGVLVVTVRRQRRWGTPLVFVLAAVASLAHPQGRQRARSAVLTAFLGLDVLASALLSVLSGVALVSVFYAFVARLHLPSSYRHHHTKVHHRLTLLLAS